MSRVRSSASARTGLRCLFALLLLLPAAVSAQDADHLLLSEVVVQTRTPYNLFGSPFIEVVNPTASAVDLTDVYLSTAHDASLGSLYWNITTGAGAGGGTSGNVHAKFPVGMSLAAGDTLVISINGSGQFDTAYGRLPDLELFEDGSSPDQVPEMVEVFTGSIGAGLGSTGGNTPALSTSFDSIVLYTWDGVSDLVQDLDYVIYGSDTRVRVDKTGVTVGGGAYAADTAVNSQTSAGSAPIFGHALARVDAVETGETQSGGNGLTGHDETSESLSTSWQDVTGHTPAAPPATWFGPAPIVTAASNGGASPDTPVNVQATVLSYDGVDAVTINYSVDGGAWLTADAASAGGDSYLGQVPGQPADSVVQWYLTVTGASGGQATWPVEGAAAARSYTVLSGGGGDVYKLLLTEISVTSTAQEYVEIANPGLTDVDLSDYYLTDAIYSPGSQFYWRIAEGNPSQATVGGGAFGDFHARFPDGYTLAAGDTIVVSVTGSDGFFGHFGYLPHLELFEDGGSADAVPDMRPVFGPQDGFNSIVGDGSTPGLSNGVEPMILYFWDGVSNLVTDIDIFIWSDGSSTSPFFCKTGVTVGGETYQDETAIAQQHHFAATAGFGSSFQRTDATEGDQPGPPGNGISGRDEVGEDWNATFAVLPYSPARPVIDVPQILSAVNSAPYDDRDIFIRATINSDDPLASVMVYYAIDGGAENELAATDNGDGTWDAVIPQQEAGAVVAWRLVAEDIEGDQGVWPSGGGTVNVTVTEAPDPSTLAQHLLITEVRARGAEFIEILNPTDNEVPLGRYFLTDAIYQFGNQFYWRITEGNPSTETIGGGAYDDFHGKFPDDAVIAPNQVITVALSGSDAFYAAYFQLPDYELFEDGDTADDVPDMMEVFPGSLAAVQEPYGNPPGLSNGGEIVILYWWDGASDLVTDVDVFFWDTTGTYESTRFTKNGVTMGASAYGPELQVSEQQPYLDALSGTQSYTRAGLDETGEDQGGFGNGVEGHDETSEVFLESFVLADATPGQFVVGGGGEGGGEVRLDVDAATFLPDWETFAVRFTTRSNSETKVRILDLEGRLVKTVYDSRFDGPASTVPGIFSQRAWDGRDATFQKVRAGTYVIHMQVVDRITGEKTVKTAPVVVATRLK
jgi:hypothetical protein